MSNIDILAEHYKVEIEGWHLFYESFIEYDKALLAGNGIVFKMLSEIANAERTNPNSEKLKETKQRVNDLLVIFEKLTGLNSRCNNLQIKLKSTVLQNLILEKENEKLRHSIESIKKAHDEAD